MRAVGHEPEALLDEMALQRRALTKVGDDLLQHVGVEDRALHVLRAGIFAALELQHLEAAPGERVGGGVAGHPRADDDGVEFLVDHIALLSNSAGEPIAAVRGKALAERLGERRQQADRVRDDADMGEIEDRRVLVGVDGDDHVRALDADAMLDRA